MTEYKFNNGSENTVIEANSFEEACDIIEESFMHPNDWVPGHVAESWPY